MRHSFLYMSALLILFSSISQNSLAALIEPESVLFQILEKNRNVTQFYAEVKVGIFDPEAFAPIYEEANINLKPYELSEKSFFQNIVFVRDEFLSIETVDENGNALHIYIEEIGGNSFSMNLSSDRVFTIEDILFPCTISFTKHVSLFEQRLYQYEIAPSQLKYEHQRFLILYQIGSDTNSLRVDPDTFKVLELLSQIQIQGRYYPLSIKFSDWNPENDAIPEVTRFYINSRLFKESRIIDIQFSRIYAKRNALVKKYQNLFSNKSPFSLDVNYGQ